MSLTFASIGSNSVLYYVPITITNSQSTASPSPFQQMVTVNSSNYSKYLASNLQNINFQDGSGNILNSWLESGNSNTSTSTIYWVKLPNGIPANSSITIYYCIYATSVNAFNTTNTGVAPNLTSTYGQYDNGSNVFTQYGGASWSNFTFILGSWTTSNGYLQQTSSDLLSSDFSIIGGPAALIESVSYTNNGNYILGYILGTAFNYTTQPGARVGLIAVATPTSTPDVFGYRFIGENSNNNPGYISFLNDYLEWVYDGTYQGTVSTPYTLVIQNNSGTWSGSLYSGYGTESSTPLATLPNTTYTRANNEGETTGYIGLSAAYYYGGSLYANPANFMWFYLRQLPPNAVMPSVTFGAVKALQTNQTGGVYNYNVVLIS